MILVFSCFHVVEFNHLLVSHLFVGTHLIGLSVSNIDLLLGEISIHPSLLEIDLLLVQIIETVSIGHPQHAVPLTLTIHAFHIILILLLLHGFLKLSSIACGLHLLVDFLVLHRFVIRLTLTLDDGSPLIKISSLISGIVSLLAIIEILDLISLLLQGFLERRLGRRLGLALLPLPPLCSLRTVH